MSPFFSPFRKSAGGKMYHSFWGEALFEPFLQKKALGERISLGCRPFLKGCTLKCISFLFGMKHFFFFKKKKGSWDEALFEKKL
ncbi:MAG: hypothetical protein J7J36_02300 [Thermoplasmata archaeon]|nr:hypothetical protein [Thermoplasmata archaeon]